MRLVHGVVNLLVVLFALFFALVGLAFLAIPVVDTDRGLEAGNTAGKVVLGIVFLLAASPMFYYVFAKNVRGLQQAAKAHKEASPPPRAEPPPPPPEAPRESG